MKRKSIFKSISMLILLAFSLTILASCSKDGKSAAPDINDVTKIIDDAFDMVKPTSAKQMGLIMKEVTPKVKGKFDMGEVSKIIKEKISSLEND